MSRFVWATKLVKNWGLTNLANWVYNIYANIGKCMTKTKMMVVMVAPELYERIRRKSEETAVPYAEVARRAWELWLITGELPKVPESKKPKQKDKSIE